MAGAQSYQKTTVVKLHAAPVMTLPLP